MGLLHRMEQAPSPPGTPVHELSTAVLPVMPRSYQVALRPLAYFRQSEEIDSAHVHNLMQVIAREQAWTTPIPVVGDHGIVMDGNHRVRAALLMGLRYLPCVPLHYSDPRVAVLHWESGEPFCVDTIHRTIMGNQIFPYKTTKHFFNPILPTTDIPLSLLRG